MCDLEWPLNVIHYAGFGARCVCVDKVTMFSFSFQHWLIVKFDTCRNLQRHLVVNLRYHGFLVWLIKTVVIYQHLWKIYQMHKIQSALQRLKLLYPLLLYCCESLRAHSVCWNNWKLFQILQFYALDLSNWNRFHKTIETCLRDCFANNSVTAVGKVYFCGIKKHENCNLVSVE